MTVVKNPIPGVVYPSADQVRKYYSEGPLGDKPLAVAFMESFSRHAERTAVVTPEGEMTYAQLDHYSDCFAAALLDLGLNARDRVVFQLVNSAELVIAVVACWKADLIPVCTLAAHRDIEISYLAQHSGAKAHFIGIEEHFDFVAFAQSIADKVASLEHIVVVRGEAEGLPSMQAMIASQDRDQARQRIEAVERDPFQVTAFQLSGGTTSVPKIIPRFSNEYLYNMEMVAEALSYDEDTVSFMPLQVIHNAAMACTFFPVLLRGGEAVTAAGADPGVIFTMITQRKPTYFGVIGSALSRMQQVNARELLPLAQVRGVHSPNAGLKTEDVLGVPGLQFFGMTEGLILWSRPEDAAEARHETVGRPVSSFDEVKILEPNTENELPLGQVGEMVSRGPYTFCGYFDAEERNKEVFTSDGFYRSGDLMSARVIDGEIYYVFEGRLKDVVDRGGEKINCEEVERLSRGLEAVADILIVGMPDPSLGERACAFIIPTTPETDVSVERLRDYLVERGLAKYKCPERVELIDEFPVTDSGKPSKPKLRELIKQIQSGETV